MVQKQGAGRQITLQGGDTKLNLKRLHPEDFTHNHVSIGYWPTTYDPNRSYTANRMADIRLQYGQHCWLCGAGVKDLTDESGAFQMAHRHGFKTPVLDDVYITPSGQPSGRGMDHRVYDYVNHPLSYMLLCADCHKRYDSPKGDDQDDPHS